MCIDKCPDMFVNLTGKCQLCEDYNNATPYYQKGECKSKCDNMNGFALYTKKLEEFNLTIEYCENCLSLKMFIEEGKCVPDCSYG